MDKRQSRSPKAGFCVELLSSGLSTEEDEELGQGESRQVQLHGIETSQLLLSHAGSLAWREGMAALFLFHWL